MTLETDSKTDYRTSLETDSKDNYRASRPTATPAGAKNAASRDLKWELSRIVYLGFLLHARFRCSRASFACGAIGSRFLPRLASIEPLAS